MMAYQLTGNAVSGGFYRRTSTCKAPRKRSFLVRVQSRAPRSEAAVVGESVLTGAYWTADEAKTV